MPHLGSWIILVVIIRGYGSDEIGRDVLLREESDLLKDGYDKARRPPSVGGAPVRVATTTQLLSLMKMKSASGELQLHLATKYSWKDNRLHFNDSEGLGEMRVEGSRIWLPIGVVTAATYTKETSQVYAIVKPDGTVSADVLQVISMYCLPSVTRFPWNSQACKLLFDAKYNYGFDVIYVDSVQPITGTETTVDGWRIRSFQRSDEHAPPSNFFSVAAVLDHEATYETLAIILPIIFITSIHIIGMFTPNSVTGERGLKSLKGLIALVTMFLIFFLGNDDLPALFTAMCPLSKLFVAEMSMTVITTIVAVVIVFAHERVLCRRQPPMGWVAKLALCFTRKAPVYSRAIPGVNIQLQDIIANGDREAFQETLRRFREEIYCRNEEDETARDWQRIFHRIDFLLMWFFLVVNSVIVLVLILPYALHRETTEDLLKNMDVL